MSKPYSKKTSLTYRVYSWVCLKPGLSAYQIADELNAKCSTVSSILKKMCDKGHLIRIKGQGPGGGYGYHEATRIP